MAKAKTAKKATARKRSAKIVDGASSAIKTTRARKSAPRIVVDESPSEPGSTSLVIVESPAKAKTIGKYLGRAYRVRATVGHVRDLPEKKMGIDIENGFEPEYVTIPGKEKTVAELKSAARDSREIFLATDPDREGEAIAWHVAQQIKSKNGAPIRRVLFHEITRDAVQLAIANAGEIDERKVEAQQARRVLDRLVGYKASPVLWKTVKKGISAGRVQTVALRLLVEREREIRAFKPVEYWTVEALLEKDKQQFTAKLHLLDGKKPVISNEAEANAILAELKSRKSFQATEVKRRERRKNPGAPFTTSTLQQDAAKKLSFGSKRTMRLAQDLYEGIEIGQEGAVGLITYMRTDSTRVAPSAADQARDYIKLMYGQQYLPDAPRLYMDSKSKNAQDAHESIRPTDPTRRPEHIRKFLKEDQYRLYELIWQRFMASQMAPAVFDTTTVDFDLGRFLFRATGSVVKFDGYQRLYKESREAEEGKALEEEQGLPVVEKGENVPVKSITQSQHFTEPPPRYSEASLVKELERLGIGRPSTYASIVSTLVDRRYASLEQRRFFPTHLGEQVEKVMVKSFPDVFNVRFTSNMETDLDKVEEGEVNWRKMLGDFYGPFAISVKGADITKHLPPVHFAFLDLIEIGFHVR
ncbi:MAG TPA: type I DNA topoisomerase, partial [Gemmatimonadaceae bacterium]|nr:type I DNA topoisomerase [Gemmatimonadaceae bacterium]